MQYIALFIKENRYQTEDKVQFCDAKRMLQKMMVKQKEKQAQFACMEVLVSVK